MTQILASRRKAHPFFRSEANSSSSHGGESTQLQLVPQSTHSEMVTHVTAPPSSQMDARNPNTRVAENLSSRTSVASDFSKLSGSPADTSPSSRNFPPSQTKEKGKSPLSSPHVIFSFTTSPYQHSIHKFSNSTTKLTRFHPYYTPPITPCSPFLPSVNSPPPAIPSLPPLQI